MTEAELPLLAQDKLIAELQRLYFLPEQVWHEQKGDSYYPAGKLSTAILQQHLAGTKTAALNLVSAAGLTRTLVIDFDGVPHGKGEQHWDKLCEVANGLQTELGLPAPAVSISGRKGYGLWISLEQTIPAATAQSFLHLLSKKYLNGVEAIDLRPDTATPTDGAVAVAKLPPCLHRKNDKWAAFITPEVGAIFHETPYLESPASHAAQAKLLAGIESVPLMAFMQALTKLQHEVGGGSKKSDGPKLIPIYAKADKGYAPPCIRSLLEKGVPHEIDYNTANMNLAAYCHSGDVGEGRAEAFAGMMADASEDHPTGKKAKADKLKNFKSNPERPFYCEYPRNTPAWAKHYGGAQACQGCEVKPDFGYDKQTSQTQTDSGIDKPVLEEAVALDLLAYAWQTVTPLQQIRYVWPSVLVVDRNTAPWYRLTAETLEAGASSAAFFAKVESYISERQKDVFTQKPWRDSAAAFFDKLQAHTVTEEAGKAALARATHLERRLTLSNAVREALGNGQDIAANVVAMQIRGAAEASLKAEEGTGPLAGLRNDLFKDFARAAANVVPTPFPRLNGLLHGGWGGGKLYVLIAPPKAGKTTLTGVCLDHAAVNGNPALYVGYEMARGQMVEYALARRLGINSKRIETRDLSEHEAELLASNLDGYLAKEGQYLELWEAGLQTSLADAAAWVTKAKAQHPDKVPLVVIDYLQLAYTGIPEIDRHQSETKRVTEVAVACKHLARQTGAAVIALSSVTKSAESSSRNQGEIDVTAARDSLAIIHAADGVLALQTASQTVTEGKGQDKEETELDPWAFIAAQMKIQGRETDAVQLERHLQKLDETGYAQGGMGYGIRARLSLLRHRGSTGDVALYYRRAYHAMEEVALAGMESIEQGNHKAEISINVFKKYVETKAPDMQQQTFDGFEPSAADTATAATVEQAANLPVIDYQYITDKAEALAAIATLQGVVGIDLETTGLSPINDQARLLQLSDGMTTLVIDLWKAGGLATFKAQLCALELVAHNAVFEMGFLYRAGVEAEVNCTMIASHVLTGKQEGLKALTLQHLGFDISKDEQTSDWTAADLTEAQLTYAALDAWVLPRIYEHLLAGLAERDSLRAYTITRDAQSAIVRMELAGMPFDAAKQQELLEGLTVKRDTLLLQLGEAMNGISPTSSTQLGTWLTEQLGGENSDKYKAWPKTSTGKLATGAEELNKGAVYLPEAAAKAVKDLLLPFKDVAKKLNSFGQSLADKINPQTGRIHCEYNLTGAITGRMSCSKPNLQQIPRDGEFRALFKASEGKVFVICDYSQMELRVAADIAQELTLIEAYKHGQDTHRLTAAMLLGIDPKDVTKPQRQLAKAVNFGLLFGQGAQGLQNYAANSYGVEITLEQAKKYREAWFKAYPAFRTWHSKSGKAAEKSLSVRTPAGRERRWASGKDYTPSAAYNTPVQGGAAECILASLAHLNKNLKGFDALPVAVIHDEIIVETTPALAEQVKKLLEESMVQGFKDLFPNAPLVDVVEAAIGATWADK